MYKFKVKDLNKKDKELKKLMKRCKKCGEIKIIIKYSKDKKCNDGRFNKCKECCKKERKTYQHICEICKKEFSSYSKYTKCCSFECMGKWRSKNLIGENNPTYGKKRPCISGENNVNYKPKVKCKCDYCGKEISRIESEYKRCKLHFCDVICARKWQSENFIGENNPNYNPNITDEEREKGRIGINISNWRKQVHERDNYTCQCCGDNKGGNLNAHHLNSYNCDKKHRTDINNGITLCENCHKELHSIYGYGNNTIEQFREFLYNKYLQTKDIKYLVALEDTNIRKYAMKLNDKEG